MYQYRVTFREAGAITLVTENPQVGDRLKAFANGPAGAPARFGRPEFFLTFAAGTISAVAEEMPTEYLPNRFIKGDFLD